MNEQVKCKVMHIGLRSNNADY